MKKVVSLVVLSTLLGASVFSASSLTRNREANFSVGTNYYTYFSGNFTQVGSDMKNYDADGYYGNAHVSLQKKKSGSWVTICTQHDEKLKVNENIGCGFAGELMGNADYRTKAYYSTINGSSNTSKQVYTIIE